MALTAEPEEQALLLELQAFDTRISQLDHRLSVLPEAQRVRDLEQQTSTVRSLSVTQSGEREDIELELSRIESDVAVVEGRIARDEKRLEGSSSVKDVAALGQELEALRKRLNDLEEIELTVMERLENHQRSTSTTDLSMAELTALTEASMAELSVARDHITGDRNVALAGRQEIEARVSKDLLALYERQRARYGTGASLLRGRVSLASGVALTENELQAIRAASPREVLICASSEAILVRTDESGL